MNQNTIIAIVVVIVLLVGGYFVFQGMNPTPVVQNTPENIIAEQENNTQTPNTNEQTGIDVEITTAKTHQVTYTNAGYSPNSLTVKAGDTVTFKNESTAGVWTGSAMHPSHIVYSGTNLQQHCPDLENDDFDQCKSEGTGTSWSFTFKKAGTWGYHNHVNATHFGKVIVE